MHHDKQVAFIRGLKQQIERGRNIDSGGQLRLPTSTYSDPARASDEWHTLFQRTPQIVGLSVDLPESGSFFTTDDLEVPVLCTRDDDGRFRAFLNVCRHRGHIVETEALGTKRRFVCPFHAWSYTPRGELAAVPREADFGGVDKACNGLVELRASERHGLLWVCVAAEPEITVEELTREIGAELDSWNLTSTSRADDAHWASDCNWKATVDTYGETYHFGTLHRHSVALAFHGHATEYEEYGRNHVMVFASHQIDEVVARPEADWRLVRAGIPVYFLYPNVQLAFLGGVVALIRIYPVGTDPNRSFSRVTYYRHPQNTLDVRSSRGAATAAAGGTVMEVDVVDLATGFGNVIDGEDYPAAVSSHRGAAAMPDGHFLLGRNEPPVQHFHQVCREALGLPPLDLLSSTEVR